MASPITVRAYVGKGGRYVRGYTRRSITAVTMKGGGGGQVGWRSLSNSRGRALTVQGAPGSSPAGFVGKVRTKRGFADWPKRRVTPSSRGRIERLFSNVQSRGKTGRFPY